jgi:predicted DNA-binding transcriptional regulator YafY
MANQTEREKRSVAIVDTLRRGVTTAESLGLQTGVSTRTIYRDIHFMQAVGVPIEGGPGVGYMLRRRPPAAEGHAHG